VEYLFPPKHSLTILWKSDCLPRRHKAEFGLMSKLLSWPFSLAKLDLIEC